MQRKTPRWHHLNFDVNIPWHPAKGATDADAIEQRIAIRLAREWAEDYLAALAR